MEVVVLPTAGAAAALVAGAFADLLCRRPDAVLGLATGSTPLPVYADLVRRHREGLSFRRARGFLLDEYVGLPADHPQSYRAAIRHDLTGQVDFAAGAVAGLDGQAADIPAECRRYEAAITAAGGVDLQILGIGTDGHLAFNEPGSSLASRTRIKTLTEQTRRDNARFFAHPDDVPHHVLTQGLGTISEARHLVLLATGAGKAAAVAAAVEGPVSASCPASVLQLHPHATVVLDDPAAGALARADHYREVYAGKPAWQHL
jgi:glucosamine-6-phosphate deaminase